MNGVTGADPRSATEIVLFDRRNILIGRLRFRTCPACRTGRILDVWIVDTWKRHGLGRELVHCLLARCPGLRWSTTLQTSQGRSFFTAMTRETSIPFPHHGPLCAHLTGRIARAWRHMTSRRRSVSTEGTAHRP